MGVEPTSDPIPRQMTPDDSHTSEADLVREREAELGPRRAGGMDPDKEAEPTPFLERRMPSSPFPAIADYAFLSDCHTGALVAPDGTVEWLCPPRFDSPSVFAALLDRSAGGWRFGPSNMGKPVGRRYEPGTNIVETTWMTPTGWMIVRDALILGKWRSRESTKATAHTRPPSDFDSHHVLVRTARCVHGTVHLEQVCEPVFGYGSRPATWSRPGPEHGVADASDGETTLRLHSDVNIGIEGGCARARHRLDAGEGCFFALSWSSRLDGPDSYEAAEEALDTTSRFWRTWLASGDFPDHRWQEHLQRSALVLKGLTYMPTGAMVAALTTSLPETPGGERNWDYRYTWMRDATFTLQGLHALGLSWEADDFIQFVADVERNEDGGLQIMYGIGGEKRLEEQTLDHLTGYEGARPGPGRQRRLRPAPERRLRRRARLDLPPPEGVRPQLAPPLAGDRGPGALRRRGLARHRPGHLGDAR